MPMKTYTKTHDINSNSYVWQKNLGKMSKKTLDEFNEVVGLPSL